MLDKMRESIKEQTKPKPKINYITEENYNKIFNHFTKNGTKVYVQIKKLFEEFGEVYEAYQIWIKREELGITEDTWTPMLREFADFKILSEQLKSYIYDEDMPPSRFQDILSDMEFEVEFWMNGIEVTDKTIEKYVNEKLERTLNIINKMKESDLTYEEAKAYEMRINGME
jgi:hypothetical protein